MFEVRYYLTATGRNVVKSWPDHRVINTIPRSPIYTQFPKSAAHRLAVTKVSLRQPINPGVDSGFCNIINQRFQSRCVLLLAGGDKRKQSGNIANAIEHLKDYKLRSSKS